MPRRTAALLGAAGKTAAAATGGGGGTPTQTLGVGGVATPSGAILATSDQAGVQLNITTSGTATQRRVYDGQGHKIGQVKIRASYVTVQNYHIEAQVQYGVDCKLGTSNHDVIIQNNDIKDVRPSGDGDLNAMTINGNDIKILYNTAINFVGQESPGSHTDAIQTWNDGPGDESTSNLYVIGNRFEGPPTEAGGANHIHQAVIGEGKDSTDGGGGGTGVSQNWFIADNYFTADCKFDDIDNVTFTRNTFAGNDKRVVVVSSLSSGFKYYSDNVVTGTYSVGIGAPVISGPGPATPTFSTSIDPGPAGDFFWKGLNWTRRADAGDPQYNGQWSAANVSGPDANGYITLSLTNPTGNSPFAAEMSSTRQGFGYGTYTCVIGTRLDTMNKATVFGGLFTYDHTQPESLSNNEIDICETSAWGNADGDVTLDHTYWVDDTNGDGQGENIPDHYSLTGTNIPVHTHQMIWSSTQVVMRSYSGTGTGGTPLFETVTTSNIPVPENERLHFNLWVFDRTESGGTKVNPATVPATSVVIRDFSFVPQ